MIPALERGALEQCILANKPVFLPDLLRRNLDNGRHDELICVLGTGYGIELPFVRAFAGGRAEIFAFDKRRLLPHYFSCGMNRLAKKVL